MSRRALAVLIAAGVLTTSACSGDSGTSPTILPGAPFSTTDIRVGTGVEATPGRRVSVDYTGWLYDPILPENKGRQFDTSVGRQPYSLTLGTGGVIRGFDQGITGMKVGGRRRVVIPPDLAYGSTGSQDGVIPPNATLVFDIELLGVT
jgi:FKBP-type peptidyl-prolyl cis-trans isomerase